MIPSPQCFAQSASGSTDYVVIRSYNEEAYPVHEDSTYSPRVISSETEGGDIVVDSAISSAYVIGETHQGLFCLPTWLYHTCCSCCTYCCNTAGYCGAPPPVLAMDILVCTNQQRATYRRDS